MQPGLGHGRKHWHACGAPRPLQGSSLRARHGRSPPSDALTVDFYYAGDLVIPRVLGQDLAAASLAKGASGLGAAQKKLYAVCQRRNITEIYQVTIYTVSDHLGHSTC